MICFFRRAAVALICFCFLTGPADAAEVTTTHKYLSLNGRLMAAEGKSLKDGVVLLTHGTLAHNRMELIETLQKGLKERGLTSLAISLSLGLTKRTGMYDCKVPHNHSHEDALDEIGVWLNWLKTQGAGDIVLMGHSRGGNQTAWFAAERAPSEVKRVVLLAPATWNAERREAGFKRTHKEPLQPILDKAKKLVADGKGDQMLKGVGVLYCPGADVSAKSFASYYQNEPRFHSPNLLSKIKVPVLVIAGAEDKVVRGLPKLVKPLADGKKVSLKVIAEAGHFFLDFFAEDVADAVAEFIAP
jgi:pimeloyl-ACP methyl ester carboxylesterase